MATYLSALVSFQKDSRDGSQEMVRKQCKTELDYEVEYRRNIDKKTADFNVKRK